MIVYDWTCEYGADPFRPMLWALGIALFVYMPIYWFGFRRQRGGNVLLRIEKHDEKDVVTPIGDAVARPAWRTPVPIEKNSTRFWLRRLLIHLRLGRPVQRLRRFLVSLSPRLQWEASYLKSVVLFSLISIVDLGFEGMDFGK
jgi:hypothetical protein